MVSSQVICPWDPLTSCYLGAGHIFRSPNEFVFHAAWLMTGAEPGRCSCVYCDNSNVGQKGRSQQLESNRRQIRNKIRSFQAAGIKVARAPNALNRQGFLKPVSPSERRVSLEEEGGSAAGTSSGDEVRRLVHRYDEMEE
jgi:hypothetical protein